MTGEPSRPFTIPPRVLLAEDDAELRALFAARLTALGFAVTQAADGDAFLEALISLTGARTAERPDHFDLVIADVHMPHFSAFDVMAAARRCLVDTPILIVTAFGDAHTQAVALRLGASRVLDKPLKLEQLTRAAEDLLERSGRRAHLGK